MMARTSFVNYLRNTLIPDLIASGRVETAQDFHTAVYFLDHPYVNNNEHEPPLDTKQKQANAA